MRDLRLAVRTLAKTPFVTIVAILSLGLGIGANTAIFSMYESMLLRSLPVPNPDELVNLGAPGPKPGSQSCGQAGDCDAVFSYAMFRDLQNAPSGLAGLAAHRLFGANLAYQQQTSTGEGLLVSGSYFQVLGLRASLGRLIGPDDDRTVGGHFVTVLSHEYWVTRFDADPNVINQTLIINGHPMTVLGVAPRGFTGTTLGVHPSVFVPITMRGQMEPGWKDFDNRRSYWAYLFGRRKPGTSLPQVRAAINASYHASVNDVEAPLQKGMSDATMKRFRAKTVVVEDGNRGQSNFREGATAPLNLLLGVTAFVLLIACANIANLLLARAAVRSGEMALRLSIGAKRRQLIGQLLTEACLLAIAGALGGLLVSHWTLNVITSMVPAEEMAAFQIGLSWPVLLFTAGLAIATGLLFGLLPALHATRPDLVSLLKGTAGQSAGTRRTARVRMTLATAQITFSMALLILAGLFTKSLVNINRVDLGINIEHLVMFVVSPELNNYKPAQSMAFFERAEDALAAIPGVSSVSASMVPLIGDSNWGNDVEVEGYQSGPDTDMNSRFNQIGPGYFQTVGMKLLAGREFSRADALGGRKVAVVNEAFAKKFKLGRAVVGKHIGNRGRALDTEIVGLVKDAKYSSVKQVPPPLFFRPYRQDDEVGFLTFYVRTTLPEDRVFGAIRGVMRRLDPNLPVEHLKTMATQVRENTFADRIVTTFATAFALLATLLAAVGLYGVLAYTIAQRTREIGLRMALGADAARVRLMVMTQVAWMTLIGGGIGLAAALGIGRVARALLFELEGHDPAVLAGATITLALVAIGAGLLPAQKASRINPIQALRCE